MLVSVLTGWLLGGRDRTADSSWIEMGPGEKYQTFLIDDFSRTNGVSSLGTRWRMFTDRVMGGVSTGTSGYTKIDGKISLRLTGSVSLANNGGFIQVALPLERGGKAFDAMDYTGVKLVVRGNGESYHLHLRTSRTRLPWQYYQGEFSTRAGEWIEILLPFEQFQGQAITASLDTRRLTRIAVVAIKKEFEADVAIHRLGFYR